MLNYIVHFLFIQCFMFNSLPISTLVSIRIFIYLAHKKTSCGGNFLYMRSFFLSRYFVRLGYPFFLFANKRGLPLNIHYIKATLFILKRQFSLSSPYLGFFSVYLKNIFFLFLLVFSQTLYFQGHGMQKDLIERFYPLYKVFVFSCLFTYL